MKLLIVEDQTELLMDISTFLQTQGYQCDTASSFHLGEDKNL